MKGNVPTVAPLQKYMDIPELAMVIPACAGCLVKRYGPEATTLAGSQFELRVNDTAPRYDLPDADGGKGAEVGGCWDGVARGGR